MIPTIFHIPRNQTRPVLFSCFRGMMLYYLHLIGLLAYTSAASVPSTLNTARDLTLSGPQSTQLRAQSNSSVAESDIWLSYCTKTERWSLPELKPDDCSGVLDYFYIETIDKDHRSSKEFKSPNSKKKTQAKTQWTPRKYTFGRLFLLTDHSPTFLNLFLHLSKHEKSLLTSSRLAVSQTASFLI